MRVGVVFPQTEIGTDVSAIVEYARAAEDLGYDHLVAYDHVLGAERAGRPPEWRGTYDIGDAFHEVFVLLGHLAAVTTRLELGVAVLVLPQRQTGLVAKQAAELDVLSRGRVRLGVGLGWNFPEFEALGTRFADRARRIEEQIEVLRLLWTNELVDYRGRWHRIDRLGLNPLPVQRPIPLWMGGDVDAAMRRIARLADGWFTYLQPDDAGREQLERFRGHVREAGRDLAAVGIEGRVNASRGDADHWARTAEGFAAMGLSHLEFNTMRAGLRSPREHIAALRRFREVAPVFTRSA